MAENLLDKKLKYWEHQLLDLGKRNKMINYRETKRATLKIVEPSTDELFNRIAIKEEKLTFQRAVDKETDIRVYSILSLLENLSVSLPVTIGDIKAEGSIMDRQKTLKHLRSKSRLALEEQGTNILYLSFGFIEWKDGKGASAKWIKSPLILVPVVLSMEALNSPYTLEKHEDDIVVNPTLDYYLNTEYGIDLPDFDEDKETLEDYFTKMEEIADKRGWRILKEVSLGLLSFLKISMYNDLLTNEERIKRNPVIRAMSGDTDEANDIPAELSDFNLDSINTHDCYQVMSADSSQQDSILYSKNNISFVMQGPPGTGKSQTITNIIAEALADGKKVLFVSEKMAALQVVYKRLQEAHLGDFCLPLHSYKANKKEILEQIGANLKLKQTRVKDTAMNSLDELQTIRNEINEYATELHKLIAPMNLSCYEVYSKLNEVSDAPSITFSIDGVTSLSQSDLQLLLNKIKSYSLAVTRLGGFIKNNPWDGLRVRAIGYDEIERFNHHLLTANNLLESCIEKVKTVLECSSISYNKLYVFCSDLFAVAQLPQIPTQWITLDSMQQIISEAKSASNNYGNLISLREHILKVFNDEVFSFDYNGWKDGILNDSVSLKQLGFITIEETDYYIDNEESISEQMRLLLSEFTTLKENADKISDLIGSKIYCNNKNINIISSLLSLITEHKVFHKVWFIESPAKIKDLLTKAKRISSEIISIKDEILKSWEQEILEFDYAPILQRYKTDYTSIFKFFKKQYRLDKKQIKSMSAEIIKKLSDEIVIDLLNNLKSYHEKQDWFNSNTDFLKSNIGIYFSGLDSEWDNVINLITVAEQIRDLFDNNVPSKLSDTLSNNYNEFSEKLSSLLDTAKASLINAKEISSKNNFAFDFNDNFDAVSLISITKKYISLFTDVNNKKSIIAPYLNGSKFEAKTVWQAIDSLNKYNDVSAIITSAEPNYKEHFDFLYKAEDTNWEYVVSLTESYEKIRKSESFTHIVSLINISDQRKLEIKNIADDIMVLLNEKESSVNWLVEQFEPNCNLYSLNIILLYTKIKSCFENIDLIEKWIDYKESKNSCEDSGLSSFIAEIEAADIFENINKCFLKGFYQMWLGEVCNHLPAVRRFRRNVQDDKIREFIKLDDYQLLIAQMRIREKLIENLPSDHHLLKATDEVAILKRELSKKKRIMPLRKLFRQIPNLLMKLKPCLMMSPLSVSYFLETEAYHFDLVIFDEASQIFPEDAIGAIFRGSQVIIAGDSKQLPPTNFFSATTNNFDNDYDIDDEQNIEDIVSDSILEESASVLPNRTLLWHYRSKHESLIAFSNREIYKNSLITFPNSANNIPDMGVEYIYVPNGRYEGGGKNCNIREAQKCVELVLEHIKNNPDRSLGIIAFSEKQQNAIENAIVEFREDNPQYEQFFDDSKEEPFFVKNLENVQGDERDTIIFSICYARDLNGKMYMRFGPLGHEGGERRLNVAITRAKCNVKLVGSILPSDIDLNRTKSDGVRMLRSYIEFARQGNISTSFSKETQGFQDVDEFCDEVAEFLTNNGYKIQRSIGCSDYKIDIAVENPDIENDFIAGIECDGLSYVQAKTARDRDHLRKSVLENMGWNMYRVWSTEWSRNPQTEKQALIDFLNSLLDKSGKPKHILKMSNKSDDSIKLDDIATEQKRKDKRESSDNPYGFQYYQESNWWDTQYSNPYDNLTKIADVVLHTVSIEQPIHMELLYKRVAHCFTTGKATEAVKLTIDQAISNKLTNKIQIDNNFARLLPLEPIVVRIPKRFGTPRQIEYIHDEEVAAAMIEIIKRSFGLSPNDLASECARAFGFERKGPKIKEKTDAAMRFLLDKGVIKIIEGKVQLIGGK